MTAPRPQTLERALRPGWYIYRERETYRITAFQADALALEVLNLATSEPSTLSLTTLLADNPESLRFAPSLAALQSEIQHMKAPSGLFDEATLPPFLLAHARTIITTVETVEQQVAAEQRRATLQDQPFQRTEVIRRLLTQLERPIALPTFYKYRRLYQDSGGSEASLATLLRRSSFNQIRMSPAQIHLLDTLILRYYNRKPPLRPETLYRLAQSVLQRTHSLWLDPERCQPQIPAVLVEELLDPKLPFSAITGNPEKAALLVSVVLPSRSWFYTYLRWFERQPEQGKQVVTTRYGASIWEQEHLVFDTFIARAALPLEYVFADHYLLDVFIVDERTRSQPDRLWLTLLIDAFSRSVLGLTLLYEPPNIMSIQTALQHAIWPKTSHTTLGVDGEWVCYGIPQQLSLDNAWAHHSHSLEDLARLISQNGRYNSIDLVFRPPYRGRYGALVERFFGNLAGQIRSYLPGTLQSSQPQHIRSAVREACLLYRDVNRFLHQAILTYQHTVHSELQGLTPHQKWLEGMQMGLPLVPPQTPEMVRSFWRMSPQTRVLSSKGVSAFGMCYGSPDPNSLARYDRQGQRIHYGFRYDPADISRLALFRDGAWVGDVYAQQLRQPDGSWLPISLTERTLAQKLASQAGASPQDWLRYLHDLDELVQMRQVERRRANRTLLTRRRAPSDVQATNTAVQALPAEAIYQDYTSLLVDFLDTDSQSRGY